MTDYQSFAAEIKQLNRSLAELGLQAGTMDGLTDLAHSPVSEDKAPPKADA